MLFVAIANLFDLTAPASAIGMESLVFRLVASVAESIASTLP